MLTIFLALGSVAYTDGWRCVGSRESFAELEGCLRELCAQGTAGGKGKTLADLSVVVVGTHSDR